MGKGKAKAKAKEGTGTPANKEAPVKQPMGYISNFAKDLDEIFLGLIKGGVQFNESYEAIKAAFGKFDASNTRLFGFYRKSNPHFGDDICQALDVLGRFFNEANPICYANAHVLVYAAIRFEQ